MKTIGIIGGISWISTAEYYRLLNEMVNKELGGVILPVLFYIQLILKKSKPSLLRRIGKVLAK